MQGSGSWLFWLCSHKGQTLLSWFPELICCCLALSPPSSSTTVLHKPWPGVPSPIGASLFPYVHTQTLRKAASSGGIFLISEEPDGASAACQCQNKDHVAAAGGDFGSWLHQGTQASCRPLPQPPAESHAASGGWFCTWSRHSLPSLPIPPLWNLGHLHEDLLCTGFLCLEAGTAGKPGGPGRNCPHSFKTELLQKYSFKVTQPSKQKFSCEC